MLSVAGSRLSVWHRLRSLSLYISLVGVAKLVAVGALGGVHVVVLCRCRCRGVGMVEADLRHRFRKLLLRCSLSCCSREARWPGVGGVGGVGAT